MSTGCQIEDQWGMYFITCTVVDWVDVFTRTLYKDIIVDSLNFCCREKGLKIYGYVIMSNHIHLILQSSIGALSDAIRDFKRFTANKVIAAITNQPESRREWMLHRFRWNGMHNIRNATNQFWIQDNRPEIIYTQDFFMQKLNYIHENPVRAGIVYRAEDYVYSSAGTIIMNRKGLLPIAQD